MTATTNQRTTTRPYRVWMAAIVFVCLSAPGAYAQQGQAAPTEFEVASIKPAAPGGRGIQVEISNGRYTAKNVTVRFLIQQAFGIRDFQISAAPAWTGNERFDVTAKTEGDPGGPEQLRPMLRALLADRFQLKFRRETKDAMGFSLVVGKAGSKMKESEGGDVETDGPGGGRPGGPGGPGGPMRRNSMIRMGRGLIDAASITMPELATQLAQALGRSVTDKTGLKGNYELKLEWTPDDSQIQPIHDIGNETAPPPLDTMGGSLFTAVQEKLGLKLESSRGPVDLLIIEKVEKPAEN